ncbi:MAG: hypothetical protein M3P51_01895 [Chloroflexota bacterium]|nr:hypothetical protein [Chloroflexota bacterium]
MSDLATVDSVISALYEARSHPAGGAQLGEDGQGAGDPPETAKAREEMDRGDEWGR